DFGVKCFVVGVEVKFDEIVLMRGRFGCKINDDVDVDVGEVEIDNYDYEVLVSTDKDKEHNMKKIEKNR
ncbi:24128_t:CDS:2, partial [Entrophospora sp. SA101]